MTSDWSTRGKGGHSLFAVAVKVQVYVPGASVVMDATGPDPDCVRCVCEGGSGGKVHTHVYVGSTGSIAVLAEQRTRLVPPLSTTPLAVKVIASPMHATGEITRYLSIGNAFIRCHR